MSKRNSPENLRDIQSKMDELRSALLKFSEEQSKTPSPPPDSLHMPLMNSIMTIQEAMRTFMSIAACRNGHPFL